MIERLAFVRNPDGDTLAFAHALREDARDPDVRGSALYTEGTVIGRYADVDRAGAVAAARRLAAEAVRGDDVGWRAHVIVALGNTHVDEVLPTILDAARAEDPRLRGAAAIALAGRVGGDAGATLTALAEDRDLEVQHAALRSMRDGVSDGDLARLARRIARGDVPPGDDAGLVTVLGAHAAHPEARPALEALLARTTDLELAARIRALLAG
jgi:hypothetical protein